MRTRCIAVLLAASAAGGIGLAVAGSSAAAASKKTTLRYYFKNTSSQFTTASGKPAGNSLAPGDHLYATVNAYKGTSAHHASKWTGTAFEYCTITKVKSGSDIQAVCDAVVSLGGSMMAGISTQNLAAKTNVYPVTSGTGKYLHVTGTVTTRSVSKKGSNAVIKIKY